MALRHLAQTHNTLLRRCYSIRLNQPEMCKMLKQCIWLNRNKFKSKWIECSTEIPNTIARAAIDNNKLPSQAYFVVVKTHTHTHMHMFTGKWFRMDKFITFHVAYIQSTDTHTPAHIRAFDHIKIAVNHKTSPFTIFQSVVHYESVQWMVYVCHGYVHYHCCRQLQWQPISA